MAFQLMLFLKTTQIVGMAFQFMLFLKTTQIVGMAFQLMLFLKTIHNCWNSIPVDVVSKNNTQELEWHSS